VGKCSGRELDKVALKKGKETHQGKRRAQEKRGDKKKKRYNRLETEQVQTSLGPRQRSKLKKNSGKTGRRKEKGEGIERGSSIKKQRETKGIVEQDFAQGLMNNPTYACEKRDASNQMGSGIEQ